MQSASDIAVRPGVAGAAAGRVLIVDDDPDVLRAYTRILKGEGYDIRAATDGEAALEAVRSEAFDVLVSDISMPRMDGISLLRAVREHVAALPVLLITGAPQLETALGAIEHGAVGYLPKPVDPEKLCHAVLRAVSSGRQQGNSFATLSELCARMDAALGSLWIAYQPVVSWRGRRLFGYEALLRTEEPSLARPTDFLLAAERLGRVHELGQAVRARIARAVPELPAGANALVNLHPRDLEDDELYDPRSPLGRVADRVILEITERASLETVAAPRERIESLRKLGFRIAIDDLGAGYAGLSCLALLEPEFVKIDMSLVRSVDARPKNRTLIRSILELCRELGIPAVAEGIETPNERDSLTGLGCDLLQGYLFGRPNRELAPPRWGGMDAPPAGPARDEDLAGAPHLSSRCGVVPNASQESGVAETLHESVTASARSKPRGILVAEDDPDIREAMVEVLSSAGHNVFQAANGREALQIAKREQLSLAVVDLMMPVMSGWEFLRIMRADPSLAGIPVIVASASQEVPEGASAYLAKPFGIESLLAAIGSFRAPD